MTPGLLASLILGGLIALGLCFHMKTVGGHKISSSCPLLSSWACTPVCRKPHHSPLLSIPASLIVYVTCLHFAGMCLLLVYVCCA